MLREDSPVYHSELPELDGDLAIRLLWDESAVDANQLSALERSRRRVAAGARAGEDGEPGSLSAFSSAIG